MTVAGSDARFKATWTNVEDFLARVGLSFDQTRTPAQIGNISADFAHTKTGGTTGLVYIGIYGWTVDPLREYYILDDWGTTMPAGIASDGTPRDHVGTITVDGGTYEVWKKTRTNKPAITGDNKTFNEYFSIRQTARQCGTFHLRTLHAVEQSGPAAGKLYEAKLLVEARTAPELSIHKSDGRGQMIPADDDSVAHLVAGVAVFMTTVPGRPRPTSLFGLTAASSRPQTCVPMVVYPNDLVAMMPVEEILAAVSASASAWSAGSNPCSYLQITVASSTDEVPRAKIDGTNNIVFRTMSWCRLADTGACDPTRRRTTRLRSR